MKTKQDKLIYLFAALVIAVAITVIMPARDYMHDLEMAVEGCG